MLDIKKHSDLEFALSQWGAKKRISEKTGLSDKTLLAIQRGARKPNESTLRLIASALGLSEDYFLESQAETKLTKRRRLVVELDLPENVEIDDERLNLIRKTMVEAGRGIIKFIQDLPAKS
ncbi:helix-turn-helix domain-containing protein [bacterium]|nr:helix-turn-helix domain-containing protein [bacterium]